MIDRSCCASSIGARYAQGLTGSGGGNESLRASVATATDFCQCQRTIDRPDRTAEGTRGHETVGCSEWLRADSAAHCFAWVLAHTSLCAELESRPLHDSSWRGLCETAGEHVFRAPCAGAEHGTLAISVIESQSPRHARVSLQSGRSSCSRSGSVVCPCLTSPSKAIPGP